MTEYMTEEAAKELEKQDVRFHNAVVAYARILAHKDGALYIDESHVKKAIKRIIISEQSDIKWFLTISMLILFGLAMFQITNILHSSELHLWLLPIFTIIWVPIIAYIFRDFL